MVPTPAEPCETDHLAVNPWKTSQTRYIPPAMKLDVRTYGDPVLRKRAQPVERVTDELRALAKDMIAAMRSENGVGLAAEQVGRQEAVIVVELPPDYDTEVEGGPRLHPDVEMPWVLFNPEITRRSDATESAPEGCLSFPDITAPVTRAVEITLRYLDLNGQPHERVLRKFLARVIQHETDHLHGVLLVDHMSTVKKIALRGQLKRLKQDTEASLA
ncbi:MAG: peptide deformylase [Kiritimatiellaeota bacterium]|nr:peptide deformylase [Kiritimatiellota bacterium]